MSGNVIVIPKSSIEELTADEMFKKLKFKKQKKDLKVSYSDDSKVYDFEFNDKWVYTDTHWGSGSNMRPDEIKAVYKKCQELGWL